MFKALKYSAVGLCVFVVTLAFLPTGVDEDELVDSFTSLAAPIQSSQSQLANMYNTAVATQEEAIEEYAGSLREQIVNFNIYVALKFGNGYYTGSDNKEHAYKEDRGIVYSCDGDNVNDAARGYSSFNQALNSYRSLEHGDIDYMYFSCKGSSYFTWKLFWIDSPYDIGTNHFNLLFDSSLGEGHASEYEGCVSIPIQASMALGVKHDDEEIAAEIASVARPGDLIWNTGGTDSYSAYAHMFMYLGDITFTDLDGNTVTIPNAVRNCGSHDNYNAWILKPCIYSIQEGAHYHYYIVHLEDVIKAIYGDDVEPVLRDNEELEFTIPDMDYEDPTNPGGGPDA